MRVAMSEKHPQECFNCIGQTHLETYSSFRSMSHVVPSVIVQRAGDHLTVFVNRSSADQCYGFRGVGGVINKETFLNTAKNSKTSLEIMREFVRQIGGNLRMPQHKIKLSLCYTTMKA